MTDRICDKGLADMLLTPHICFIGFILFHFSVTNPDSIPLTSVVQPFIILSFALILFNYALKYIVHEALNRALLLLWLTISLMTFGGFEEMIISLIRVNAYVIHIRNGITFLGIMVIVAVGIKIAGVQGITTGQYRAIKMVFKMLLLINVLLVSQKVLTSSSFLVQEKQRNQNQRSSLNPPMLHIMLDGYGRQDVLARDYSFDNSPFIYRLKKLGFQVNDRAKANYPNTVQSLASLFRMEYVDEVYFNLEKYVKDAYWFTALQHRGYSSSASYSGVAITKLEGYFDEYDGVNIQRNDLTYLLFRSSLVSPLCDLVKCDLRDYWFNIHRDRIVTTLKTLPERVRPGHYYFAHILIPHPPFLFEPDGSAARPLKDCGTLDVSDLVPDCLSKDEYHSGYISALRFLNDYLLFQLEKIVMEHPDSVIILHSDHGPGSTFDKLDFKSSAIKERYSILLAIRLPAKYIHNHLLPDSPVNILRWIATVVFNDQFKPLPYMAFYFRDFKQFEDVTFQVESANKEKG